MTDQQGQVVRPAYKPGQRLGMLANPVLDEPVLELRRGARPLLYTAGLTDGGDPAGNCFGAERLEQTLQASHRCSTQELCDQLVARVTGYRGLAPQFDEVTLLAAQAD